MDYQVAWLLEGWVLAVRPAKLAFCRERKRSGPHLLLLSDLQLPLISHTKVWKCQDVLFHIAADALQGDCVKNTIFV